MYLKKIGKLFLCYLLEGQVRKLLSKNEVTIIAVGGSVGKTSTKLAIAKTLESWTDVIYQDGNYNDRLTVPLVLFGQTEPSIFNIFAWLRILRANYKSIKQPYPYKHAVLELGTDGPGQLKDFAYLKPDLYVLTAIADEHMEYFKTLDAVAAEELTPSSFSKQTLINLDTVNPRYLVDQEYLSYSAYANADYSVKRQSKTLQIYLKGQPKSVEVTSQLLGDQGAMIILAAASVNHLLGKTGPDIRSSLEKLDPVPGRMQLLKGRQDSLIIDDTYNSSPLAAKAALDVLYSFKYKKRIAVLGSMNELGPVSKNEHQKIGNYCDPTKLVLVITIGREAKEYLAPAAKQRGCQVVSFTSPYEAGQYLQKILDEQTVVLAKGSQNGVFAEEAVKQVLADPADGSKLVRQSKYWLKLKSRQFPEVSS